MLFRVLFMQIPIRCVSPKCRSPTLMNVLRKYKHMAESCCCTSGATLRSHFTLDIISTAHSGSCLLTEVRQTTEGGVGVEVTAAERAERS